MDQNPYMSSYNCITTLTPQNHTSHKYNSTSIYYSFISPQRTPPHKSSHILTTSMPARTFSRIPTSKEQLPTPSVMQHYTYKDNINSSISNNSLKNNSAKQASQSLHRPHKLLQTNTQSSTPASYVTKASLAFNNF